MNQTLSPDIFNTYTLLATDSNGNAILSRDVLRLPAKADNVIFSWIPSGTFLSLNGQDLVLDSTVVDVSQIESGLLVWRTSVYDGSLLFDSGYYAFDLSGEQISLLQVYYPTDIVINITNNVVNGGNFKIPEDGEGYDTDAGDFDTGVTVLIGYSYNGGDFNTGEVVGVLPPPASPESFYLDGELDPERDNGRFLLDENFELISTQDLPNIQYFAKAVVETDLTIDVNYTIDYEVAYVTKYFEGFDYGSVIPDFGHNIDYGSLDIENQEGYDFNSIQDYTEPTQVSGVA